MEFALASRSSRSALTSSRSLASEPAFCSDPLFGNVVLGDGRAHGGRRDRGVLLVQLLVVWYNVHWLRHGGGVMRGKKTRLVNLGGPLWSASNSIVCLSLVPVWRPSGPHGAQMAECLWPPVNRSANGGMAPYRREATYAPSRQSCAACMHACIGPGGRQGPRLPPVGGLGTVKWLQACARFGEHGAPQAPEGAPRGPMP